jgi:holo-[acyl-carrier protein] synthase
MIVGLGIDTVGIARVRQIITRHGARFLGRWFDPAEAAYITAHADGAERAAVRWAAKEAAAKALGTGFAGGIVPSQISVLPGPGGTPLLHLAGAARTRADALGATRLHVSLSHADGAAVAVVILEKP